jgi:hypothetical protein
MYKTLTVVMFALAIGPGCGGRTQITGRWSSGPAGSFPCPFSLQFLPDKVIHLASYCRDEPKILVVENDPSSKPASFQIFGGPAGSSCIYVVRGQRLRIACADGPKAPSNFKKGFWLEPGPLTSSQMVLPDRDGDFVDNDSDRCPDVQEDIDDFEDEDGCPEFDNDRDGIHDFDDQCPNEAEDKDGFEDEDGCPEGNGFDRDGDGILDKDDQCLNDPGKGENGCPLLTP